MFKDKILSFKNSIEIDKNKTFMKNIKDEELGI